MAAPGINMDQLNQVNWVQIWPHRHTGSSRKNDKSNLVFRGTNSNKNSVFSPVLDQELATNSSFRAPRSITITRWLPWKLTPPICFQALVCCLRPTTASHPLNKVPHCVFWLVCSKISAMNTFIFFYFANFVPHKPKHTFWVFAESLRVSGRPKAAHQSPKANWRRQLLRMPPGDSEGPGSSRGWICR